MKVNRNLWTHAMVSCRVIPSNPSLKWLSTAAIRLSSVVIRLSNAAIQLSNLWLSATTWVVRLSMAVRITALSATGGKCPNLATSVLAVLHATPIWLKAWAMTWKLGCSTCCCTLAMIEGGRPRLPARGPNGESVTNLVIRDCKWSSCLVQMCHIVIKRKIISPKKFRSFQKLTHILYHIVSPKAVPRVPSTGEQRSSKVQ